MSSPNIPDPLRERLLRQSKRVKLVRITFALTITAALVLSFGVALFQGVQPTVRATDIALRKGGDKPEAILLDQTFDPATARGSPEGTFRLALLRNGEIKPGAAFRGVANSLALDGDKRVYVVFESHFLEFDLSGEGENWPKLLRQQNLGINETGASPSVAVFDGRPWLCWYNGKEVRIRPLLEPDIQPALVQADLKRGAMLNMVSAEGFLWVSVVDRDNGALKLLWFKPRLDPLLPEGGDGQKDGPTQTTNIESLHTSTVTKDAKGAAVAVLSGQPVALVSRREKDKQADTFELWRMKADGWSKETLPEFPANALLASLANASISAAGDTLALIHSDGRAAHLALGKVKADKLEFGAPSELALGNARGLGPMLVWVGVMLGIFMLLAGQGLWLLLNRSQELDRTLAAVLADKEKQPGEKKKDAPKAETLLHATLLARAIALLVDLGVTSPAVIMLKSVYNYEWTQAYGFLLPVGIQTELNALLATLQASVVTLSILTLYAMVCELIWGRTFGKALLHLRVVDAEGEQPSALQIIVRNFVRVFEVAHWAVFLIPAMLMMMGGKQQRLGDMLARTYVIVDVVPEDQADDLEI